MASISDLFFTAAIDDSRLPKQAATAGEKAGTTLGQHMESAFSKGKFGANIVAGFGAGLGIGVFQALTRGIGDVISAIPDAIKGGQEFALTVDDISDKTGASAETASRFAGTLQYLGIQTNGLGTSLRTLSTEIVANESKFSKLGIQTRDSNGELLDTITILGNVRTYLSGAEDGATKMALASDLLGRSAGELIDFLNLTDAEAQALAMTMDELGVTISETARKDAEQLRRETNLLGLAWQGLSNTLANEAAPTIRKVIGGLTSFIKENGAGIRQTFLDITNAVLGFVSGIAGLGAIEPFQMQLDKIADGGGDVSLSFEQWAQQMGHTIPKIEKTTGSTKAGTDAIDKQIKSVERRIDAAERQDDAEETVFQRTMKRLGLEYDAQLDSLDLQERQLAMAEKDKDLAERLRQAKIDLFEAQAQRGADRTAGKADDPTGVVRAQQAVLDAQKAISDEAAQRDRDSQRARLEGVKTYIENVAQIEADSENKKALASTLEKRRIKLLAELATATEAGKANDIADINARLEAVKTAEERTQSAIKNGAREDELEGLKAQLQKQRDAIAAAGSGQVSDNAKTLAALKTQYDKWIADQETTTKEHIGVTEQMFAGDASKGTGLGGAITKAFQDGQAAGVEFRKAMEKIGDAVGVIVDGFRWIVDHLDKIALAFRYLTDDKFREQVTAAANEQGNPLGVVPSAIGSTPAGAAAGGAAAVLDWLLNRRGKSSGGPAQKGMPYIVGERRPELFVPNESGTIIPSLAGMGGWMGGGGEAAIIRVEVGGNKLLDYIDEGLSYRRR